MEKNVLEQYLELREEIKDLHDRIDRDKRRLIKIENEGVVSDLSLIHIYSRKQIRNFWIIGNQQWSM